MTYQEKEKVGEDIKAFLKTRTRRAVCAKYDRFKIEHDLSDYGVLDVCLKNLQYSTPEHSRFLALYKQWGQAKIGRYFGLAQQRVSDYFIKLKMDIVQQLLDNSII